MDNWMIGSRLAVLLYCIIRYIGGNMENTPAVVLLALAYISITMAGCIAGSRNIKMCFRAASVLLLSISAATADLLFILLITFDILELASGFTEDYKAWLIFVALPMPFLGVDILPEYLLVGAFAFLVFLLALRFISAQSSLREVGEKLRDKSEELRNKLYAGTEYESRLRYLSQLEERNSLAQKIHDRVGHTIAGSIIQLEAAGMIIGKDSEKAAGIISAVNENLKEGMGSIRSALRNIKPAPEQLGINRLKLMTDEVALKSPMKAALSYSGNLEAITHLQWRIITDNIYEALTNAIKYSSATNIYVKLDVMNRLIKAEVRDNGKGAFTIKKGMGLTGMEERTENAGGELIVDGSNGFSVITLLPAAR